MDVLSINTDFVPDFSFVQKMFIFSPTIRSRNMIYNKFVIDI